MVFPALPFFTLAGSFTVILSMATAASATLGSTTTSTGVSASVSASSTLAMSGLGSSWGSSSGKIATGWTGPGTEMDLLPPLPLPAGPELPLPLTLATWQDNTVNTQSLHTTKLPRGHGKC